MSADRSSIINFRSTVGILIVSIATAAFSPATYAQTPQQILQALDADGDGAISKSEAQDDMKQNFSFIDVNGDGGIDAEELDRILKLVESQN